MTQEEQQSIINAVLSAIRTNSRTIAQLTAVPSLSDSDSFEVSGGKRVTYGVLKNLIAAFTAADTDTLLSQINRKELQSVTITTTETTATLTITNVGGTSISCSVPVATDNTAGIITATQKVKIDSAYSNAQSALSQAGEAKAAAQSLNNKLGAASGIATLDTNGKLNSSQVPSDLATDAELAEVDAKADAAQEAADAAQEAADDAQSAVDTINAALPKYDDTLEFAGVMASATVTSGTSTKKSTDNDAQVFYVTALKQFVLGVRTDVEYSAIMQSSAPLQAPLLQSPDVATRLTDAQIKEAIALADFPNLYTFYLDWADRELYSNDQYTPHSGKTFICTSTDTSYYWKSSVPALQPMGKDFTNEIQAVQDNVDNVAADVEELETSVAPRLFFNGNVLLNLNGQNVSLDTFLTNTASGYAFIKKTGVVITLQTEDGMKSYQWNGTAWGTKTNWKDFGGSATVGNCYNVTNEASDLLPVGTGYFTLQTAIQATQTKGVAAVGMQITFAVAEGVWKTFQYIGASIDDFTDTDNWLDMASMSAGSEPVLNVNDLCGACTQTDTGYYNLAYAIAAITAKETATGVTYRKSGLVITYRTGNLSWETKQFVGAVVNFGTPSDELWKDFGGGGQVTPVTVSDEPEEDGTDAFSTGGAYNLIAVGVEQLIGDDIPETLNDEPTDPTAYYYYTLVSEAGPIGTPFAIPIGSGGSTTSTVRSIALQTSPIKAAAGGSFWVRASIRSVVVEDNSTTDNEIQRVEIVDRDTAQTLYVSNALANSSSSATDYSFNINLSSYFTAAATRRLQIIATDGTGARFSRNFSVVAIDVTCECVQVLQYNQATVVFTTDNVKALNLFQFPNNQGSITAFVDMLINGTWTNIGRSVVTNTYAVDISINPTSLGLTHGGYLIRMYGIDTDSLGTANEIKGNTVYSTVMVVNPTSTVPIVAIRYNDTGNGTVKLYETVNLEIAAYQLNASEVEVSVLESSNAIAQLNVAQGTVETVARQINGVAQNTSLAYQAVTTGAASGTITLTVSGSVIDETLTGDALCTFDFANRSNSEAGDHEIVDGSYEIEVTGANWSSNGFGKMNENDTNALAIKENVTAELNLAPFATTGIASTGFSLLFRFASANIADNDAHLMECYSASTGAGFYVTGQAIGIYRGNKVEERTYPNGEKVTVGILVEPAAKYVTFKGTQYSLIKLFINGEESACIEYASSTPGALVQPSDIKFNGTEGDFYLYYLIAWMRNIPYMAQFSNYLVKLTDTVEMVQEHEFEDVWGVNKSTVNGPGVSYLSAKGMPYLVEQPFMGSDISALDNTISTSDNIFINLTYRDPNRPWRNFIAYNVRRRNQGTTSAKRPVKNARYNLAKKNKNTGVTYYVDGVAHTGCFIKPELSRADFIQAYPDANVAHYDEAAALFASNKIRVGENTIPVDVITVKVDYSDSTNANDCGACNMMNATYRALGASNPQYLTPAQRYFDGTYDIGSGANAVHLTGLQLNHSTANHPIAMYRDYDGSGTTLKFYAKGNWKEDKNESKALGFFDTPGYNADCLSYQNGDFVEFFGTSSETLAQAVTRFLSASTEKDTSKVYLISQYCGSAYKFYRYQNGAWTDTTGTMKQVNGVWTVTGDVLNPVDGFELLGYEGMCWWQGVASVSDMMAPVESQSSWVQKLVNKEGSGVSGTTFPAWTQYFECMIDNDQLQADLAMGRKCPYWLYRLLKFCNDNDYSDENVDLSEGWHDNLYKQVNPYALYVYDAFTDYLAAVDQQAKNMQPMFFLDEGGSVEGGVYKYNGVASEDCAVRMYPNKVYDADTLLGKDNAGGATVDPEVDPNKPTDATTGYNNPYAGWGSVLWNNIYRQPTVKVSASAETDMETVVGAMRSVQATIDGVTLNPFSPAGCKHFFIDNICKRWQKTVSSYDGENKYIDSTDSIDTSVEDNTLYFYALHGLRLTTLPSFIDRRFRVRDGFYGKGLFFSGVWSARISAGSSAGITIKAAKTGYFGVGSENSGTIRERVYLEAGQSHRFTIFDRDSAGSSLYIYQADRIKEIDLSEINIGQGELSAFSAFTLAEKIVLGGDSKTNSAVGTYGYMTAPVFNPLPFLKELNIKNTVINEADVSRCPRLEKLDASGTALTSVTLAETSPISVLSLPSSITELFLVNLPNLAYESGALTIASVANLRKLRIEGCPNLDGLALLNAAITASASLTNLRMTGLNVIGASSTLVTLRTMGVHGLDANGADIAENVCSSMIGTWTCSDVIEATTLTQLQAYFPNLTVYNAQYTVVEINERVASYIEPAIKNLDNGTTITSTLGYQPSGHISKIKAMLHVYKALYDSEHSKMQCWQVDDDDIRKLKDGTSFDRADSDGTGGYDVMLGLPHFWYKGVNDHINQKKYLILSAESSTPRSSARTTRREDLGDLLIAEQKAVIVANFNAGDTFSADNLSNNIVANVYSMDVAGMKQVRWPALNSLTAGVLFLDADGKVISKSAISVSDEFNDMQTGDYVFMSVPANAKTFIFTSPTGCDDVECIAVDSTEIEAIEPDWVEHDLCLVGTYKGYIDGYWRLRSLSGKTPINGSGTATTWTGWANGGYDTDGNVIKSIADLPSNVPNGMNRTYLDLRNLSRLRGTGFQLVDYEMHKIVNILFIAFYGTKNSQSLFGNGQNGAATGGSDVYSDNLGSDYSPMREASRPRFMGLEDWWGSRSEWMDYIALNVASYAAFYKNRLTDVPSGSSNDHYYRVRMPDGTERAILCDPSTSIVSGEIVRFRWGRYCDVIPSKLHSNSNYNQYWCDQMEGSNSTGRVVLRSGFNSNAYYGFAFLSASNASSGSNSNYGSRLAFRGVIEIVE